MSRLMALLVVMLLTVSVASAVPVDCGGGGIPDVEALADGCFLGSLLFDDFFVSNPSVMIGLNAGLTGIFGDNANLNFEVNPQVGPLSTVLIYSVSNLANSLLGVDLGIGSFSGSGVSITETVCSAAPNITTCEATVLATLAVDSNLLDGTLPLFVPKTLFAGGAVGSFWVIKDIQIASGSTLSDFSNSHHVPEPMTFLLMGTGLLALGLLRRRKRK